MPVITFIAWFAIILFYIFVMIAIAHNTTTGCIVGISLLLTGGIGQSRELVIAGVVYLILTLWLRMTGASDE